MELKGKVPGLKLDVLDGVLVGEEQGEQGDVQGDPDHQVGDVHLDEDRKIVGLIQLLAQDLKRGNENNAEIHWPNSHPINIDQHSSG